MKTLDEVIFEAPYSPTPWEVDALHYLKEYKEHLKWHAYEEHCLDNEKKTLQEKKAEFDEVLTDYVALRQWWTEQQENSPLSWEQLKQMEGKPVWVEHIYYKKWQIVKDVYEETIVLDGNGFYTQYFSDDNEKETRWQAYRKERK